MNAPRPLSVDLDQAADGYGLSACVICGRMNASIILVGERLAYACPRHTSVVERLLG